MPEIKVTMEKLVSLCKRRAFIFAGSEIYGGFSNSYTYGPYGSALKKNIKDLWWKTFVETREDLVGIDGPILLHPKTWEASGHVGGFSDALVDCKECRARLRADHLIEEQTGEDPEGWPVEKMGELIQERKLKCPKCGKQNFTEVRHFNLMFSTELSKTGDEARAYLRPETAQAIFTEFKNILSSTRVKLPFGIAQIGKAFRNEITPGNFIFRLLEFEQMEIEYFIREGDWEEKFEEWKETMWNWCKQIGLSEDKLRFLEHKKEKLSHYSKRTVDIEYDYPFGGFKELYGLAYRTDFDLKQHEKFSGEELRYRDPETNEKFVPHVIEPTFGLDRTILAVLVDAYSEVEDEKTGSRIVLRLNPKLAPVKIAIFPLHKKLSPYSKELFKELSKHFVCEYDEGGSIGKRYARQDEIGTPFCLTVDFDTAGEGNDVDPNLKDTVTVRDRDTGEQARIKVEDLILFFMEKLS